jgi:hypothetical protein
MQTLEHHIRYLRRTAIAVGVTAGLTLLAVAAGFLAAGTELATPAGTTGEEIGAELQAIAGATATVVGGGTKRG